MYGTVIDTTEQKNILEDLKESETKFRLLADSMPGFVWTTDANGRPTYFSQPLYDFSGLTLEEIIHVGGLVHPDEREENIRSWDEAVATGKDYIFEHRYRRQDGEYRWQLSRAVPQRDSKGNIQMWIGTSTDIHDRKLFTDELEQEVQERTKELSHANNELLRSNSELAQFAYVASHDLQEPLRKIQTFASRIFELENDKLSDKGKEYFDRMQTASLRMQQLIKDLLSFSRINTEEKQFKQTDLNAILAAAQEQLNEQIEQKHAVIRYANLPVMNVIAYQFEQLFTNLINNSLKFSKDNVAPEIDISAALADAAEITPLPSAAAEKYYHLSIKDNGIGFEPEYNERIFLVFQRLHGNEKYQGTGIGLAICKRIVENHKGIITASGELGKGACFDIYIPAL
jgi:PAS domain S-box-containing protein